MNPLEIYTDGSCLNNPGPGGWAYLYSDHSLSNKGGEKYTTNNRMEMTAIIEALSSTPEGSSVTIFTDSMFVVNGMTKWVKNWKKKGWKLANGGDVKNKELWITIDQLNNSRTVAWKWVKAHSTNELNNEVDRMANEEASKQR